MELIIIIDIKIQGEKASILGYSIDRIDHEIKGENNMQKDMGPNVHALHLKDATKENTTFRTAIWTGKNLQLTVMSIAPGDDIGMEVHTKEDQFFRIEKGNARLEAGEDKDNMTFVQDVKKGFGIFIPAGTWHNIINTGDEALKLYTIYAPTHHAHGTVHVTKDDDTHD